MQWIKKNIVMFGGDPDQITLFSGCIEYCGYYLILGLDRICWISQCGIPPVVSSLQGSFYPGNSSVSLSSQPLGIDHKKGSKVESVKIGSQAQVPGGEGRVRPGQRHSKGIQYFHILVVTF